jgi:hypothetical protein
MTSSSSQKSPEPDGLLQIVTAVFSGVLFGLVWLRIQTPFLRSADSLQQRDNTSDARKRGKQMANTPIRVAVESLPSETPSNERTREKQKKKQFKWCVFGVNVLTLGAVAWYAVLTQMQLRTTKEHFRTDERAWVGIEPIKPILKSPRMDKFGAGFIYELYPKNTGKTVARCVEIRSTQQALSSSIVMGDNAEMIRRNQEEFLLGKFKNSEGIPIERSAPRALAPGQMAPIPLTIFGQEPQTFPNAGWVDYLIGRMDYADEFGVQHWVKFCFFIANAKGELRYCKYGNDEDNNPETPPTIPGCTVTTPPV